MAGRLYLVATPIGNLSDLSPRALETLSAADFIAAEDTRVTLGLLNHFEIKKPLVSYYAHNMHTAGPRIVERLLLGESCALVTDAGMPAVSDPGEELVKLCAAAGVETVPIPGACALVCALAASGLPTGRFCFEGFLAASGASRFEHLESLKNERRTMIFYEAPHKLCRTLADMLEAFGERDIAVCRELTKLFEQTLRTNISGAIEYFNENRPRGEFVLVVSGATETKPERATPESALETLAGLRESGQSLKEAARNAAAGTGWTKNELYDLAVKEGKGR